MKYRVLVVDDNAVNLRLMGDVLELDGYRVSRAMHAEAALLEIEKCAPEIIIMDIELPTMDGLTLTRQLKTDPKTRSIPIMAVTAFAMRGDRERAIAAGCDGYLTKPIDTRVFPVQVADVLRKVEAQVTCKGISLEQLPQKASA